MAAQVTINGNPLSAYNAKLVDYDVGASSYDSGYFLPMNSIVPVKLPGIVGLRPIYVVLDFEGESDRDIALSISTFTAFVKNQADFLMPDGFHYKCVYETASTPVKEADWIWRVEFKFYGYMHGDLETVEITDGQIVTIKGTHTAPARYTIVPATSTTVSVNGITVRGVTSTVTIDGMNATVTMDAINKFGDTDIVEFPKLPVGANKMYVTGDATVTLEYYPIYM